MGKIDLYEPIGVLKTVAADIWIADGPIERMDYAFGLKFPFPTRMAVIRLPSGELFVWSPIAADDALYAAVEALGAVKHLVSPNKLHYAHMAAWKQRFPEALLWASPGVQERAQAHGVHLTFDAPLEDRAPPAWAGVIEQVIVRGGRAIEEAVFFHAPSSTALIADLIENFELMRVNGWIERALIRYSGAHHPHGSTPADLKWTFFGRKRIARRAVSRILDWRAERAVIAHGRWYETNAEVELRRALSWLGPFDKKNDA